MTRKIVWLAGAAMAGVVGSAPAQRLPVPVKVGGSPNVQVVAHIPIRGFISVGDLEIEQELSRPYAYVGLARPLTREAGFVVVNLKDPSKASILYRWLIENSELHAGVGGFDGKYFKHRGRYYYIQGFQFGQSGPDADVGAIVFDVTSLPDTTGVKQLVRIRAAGTPNGFHNIFAYKHSDGRPLLFATVSARYAHVYDLDRLLAGDANYGLIGQIPVGDTTSGGAPMRGYHDFYVAYDPATHQDKFYGPGAGGFYVYDVTHPEQPRLLTSVTGMAGMQWGHTFTPTPDGRYAVLESEYQYAPLRIVDLKPGLDGQVKTISRPIGAWMADWKVLPHNHEVRWPYVFVSAYEDGLQIFNLMDPTNPYTVGYYFTCECPHGTGWSSDPKNPRGQNVATGGNIYHGAEGLDVRNADGLIVISDWETGFWAFKMDGFDGWNGHQWGMPNISSAQDWDNGPEGAPKAGKVS